MKGLFTKSGIQKDHGNYWKLDTVGTCSVTCYGYHIILNKQLIKRIRMKERLHGILPIIINYFVTL